MTLVNGYEIEINPYYCNDIRYSIMNNANIEDKLNVVIHNRVSNIITIIRFNFYFVTINKRH